MSWHRAFRARQAPAACTRPADPPRRTGCGSPSFGGSRKEPARGVLSSDILASSAVDASAGCGAAASGLDRLARRRGRHGLPRHRSCFATRSCAPGTRRRFCLIEGRGSARHRRVSGNDCRTWRRHRRRPEIRGRDPRSGRAPRERPIGRSTGCGEAASLRGRSPPPPTPRRFTRDAAGPSRRRWLRPGRPCLRPRPRPWLRVARRHRLPAATRRRGRA